MARLITFAIANQWLVPRPKNAHKGTSGRVLIIAGSRGMAGAAVLSAMGAVRSGAGLVKVATVQSQQPIVAKRAPLEVTTFGLPEDKDGRLSKMAWPAIKKLIRSWKPDIVAMGPGLGLSVGVTAVVKGILSDSSLRLVLDADGLNTLADLRHSTLRCSLILTPHVGELVRLLKWTSSEVKANRASAAKKAAIKYRAVCLLKGAGTVITDGKTVWKNTTGNPAMASGGMGDVLTGIISAQWAQNRDSAITAAALGAFLHGLAADMALKNFPERSMVASDVAVSLPAAFKKIALRKRTVKI